MLLAMVSGSFQQFQPGVSILSSTATSNLDIEGSINAALNIELSLERHVLIPKR